MGVEINIEHPEGKQSGAYCATDRRPMAHGIVSRIGYNSTGHGRKEKAAPTNDLPARAIRRGPVTRRPQYPQLPRMPGTVYI
jgi:hypothetical protein